MDDLKIKRINELARLSKVRDLNNDEIEERDRLRKEYILSIRKNLRSQLDSIRVKEDDGTIRKLKKKR